MDRFKIIYLVDNDSSARRGLSNYLKTAGYRVKAFSSASDFFQLKSIAPHACIIIDVSEPDFLGVDLKTVFSKKQIDNPIIFLSATEELQTRDLALAAGAAGFFRKPIDGPALLDVINWETGSSIRASNGSKTN